MAFARIGVDPLQTGTYSGQGYTCIMTKSTMGSKARGVLRRVTFRSYASPNVKIKIFRNDGTNFVFVGEYSLPNVAANGLNSDVPVYIPAVSVGDYIGFYTVNGGPNAQIEYVGGYSPGDMYFRGGDITATSLISAWSVGQSWYQIQGDVFTDPGLL